MAALNPRDQCRGPASFTAKDSNGPIYDPVVTLGDGSHTVLRVRIK